MSHVLVAMSGGVDSSVAAALLLEQGHRVTGLFMRHGQAPATQGSTLNANGTATGDLALAEACRPGKARCCSAADADDARAVADSLGIPFYALDFSREFGRIVDYFVDEYTAGRTPNPCIACNSWLKFGRLFEYADGIGADFVATGHYARVVQLEDGASALLRGLDAGKDQSYVLYGIPAQRLPRVIFPVGHFSKEEIRRRATDLGLHVAEKPDSQEICFVPNGDHAAVVRRLRNERERADTASGDPVSSGVDSTDLDSTGGEIVTLDGRVVGQHEGLERYTVGQRKGLGVALGEPHYVIRLESDTRRVVLGRYEDLARTELTISGVNWLVAAPRGEVACEAKIRYRSPATPASAWLEAEGRVRVRLHTPCYGVSPGQSCVLYWGERVIAGGIIR